MSQRTEIGAAFLRLAEEINTVKEPTASSFTYDDSGNISTVTDVIFPNRTKVSTINYNEDSSVNTIVVVFEGIQHTKTFNYTDGVLTSVSVERIVL